MEHIYSCIYKHVYNNGTNKLIIYFLIGIVIFIYICILCQATTLILVQYTHFIVRLVIATLNVKLASHIDCRLGPRPEGEKEEEREGKSTVHNGRMEQHY